MSVSDSLGRPVRDLRISVTDRCNFRCTYCMPKEIFNREYEFLAREALLSFEETDRVACSFVRHGVRKLRLTGGEPLLRKGIEGLIAQLALIPDLEDLTLTTNGALLGRKAAAHHAPSDLANTYASSDAAVGDVSSSARRERHSWRTSMVRSSRSMQRREVRILPRDSCSS